MNYLIESALLIHGIKNIPEDTILKYWNLPHAQIAWMEQGEIKKGDIEQLMDFRRRMRESGCVPRRANHYNLDEYIKLGADAVLTASGTMSVCTRNGTGTAVTAGIGGFFPEMLEENDGHLWTKGFGPPDVATLVELSTVLVSSGPKDMLDYRGTIRYLDEHKVSVCGVRRRCFSGYMFKGEEAPLPKTLEDAAEEIRKPDRSVLIINEIEPEKRIDNRVILDQAVEYGLEQEKQGGYYHPAVNAKIEELTSGYSALLQLAALLSNAQLAETL